MWPQPLVIFFKNLIILIRKNLFFVPKIKLRFDVKVREMSEPTDTVTIRVPKSLKEQLEKASKKNQVTLNNLVNQILFQRMHWDEQLNKMGWLQFEPNTVKQLIKYLSEDEMDEIVNKSKKGVAKTIKFLYGDTSVDHVAEFIDSWLTATNMPFKHTEDNQSHKFLVTHDLGKNWSIFANKAVIGFTTEIGHKILSFENKEDSYTTIIQK